MKKRKCFLFNKGLCNDKKCKYFHGPEYEEKSIIIQEVITNKKARYHEHYYDIEGNLKFKFEDISKEDINLYCVDYLEGGCLNEKCQSIHNISLKNKNKNILEFQKILKSTKDDFNLIEPYEREIIGETSLDLLFICSCTY